MKINQTTMLWEDISSAEREEMQRVAEDIVLRGKVPYPVPSWINDWLTAFGYDERQALLVMSTAIPQRILLSLTSASNQKSELIKAGPIEVGDHVRPTWAAEVRAIDGKAALISVMDKATGRERREWWPLTVLEKCPPSGECATDRYAYPKTPRDPQAMIDALHEIGSQWTTGSQGRHSVLELERRLRHAAELAHHAVAVPHDHKEAATRRPDQVQAKEWLRSWGLLQHPDVTRMQPDLATILTEAYESGLREAADDCAKKDLDFIVSAIRAAKPGTTWAWREVADWLDSKEGRQIVGMTTSVTARPLDEWHEDYGVVVWWTFPVHEPPYVGTPLDDDFPLYMTHWTRLPPVPVKGD